jgi:peptidoglycan/LPS O-acetylase OafA/YrhL
MHAALGKASHAAVVVFFVISGYVIAFTTATNNRGPWQYAVARLSRLYSMLVPALVFTAVVEVVVVHSDALLAARYVRAYSGGRYLLTLLFGNELGFWSAAPALNSPLWSLSYEFWYYTLFGIWFYRGGWRKAGLWLLLASLLAGPKILLLLPIWLLGVAAYHLPKPKLAAVYAWIFVGSLLLFAGAAVACLPTLPAAVGDKPLFMAGQFVTDWLVGALFAVAIWCLPRERGGAPSGGLRRLRTVADLSFPLYVLHFPLLVLWRAMFGWRENDLQQLWQVVVIVGLIAGIAGFLLERQRGVWVRFFNRMLGFIWKKPGAGRFGAPD